MSYSTDNGFRTVRNPGLARIKALLEELGNPQKSLQIIHVAGTNGKGSVCAFLRSVLSLSGYRTGLFTSPHLLAEEERIAVDGTQISRAELDEILSLVQQAADRVCEKMGETCTLFERYTAAALVYFQRMKTDVAILEAGMGGRLDTTNVIENPVLSIITRIAIDHQEYLGDTPSKIAGEKAGILKTSGKSVLLYQSPEVNEVFKQYADAVGNDARFTAEPTLKGWHDCREIFDYRDRKNLCCGLCGKHQVENACIAIDALDALKDSGFSITEEAIRGGIKDAVHHARFEIIDAALPLIIDGAHNPDGMRALKASLDRYFPGGRRAIVFGVMRDKPIDEMIEILGNENTVFYPVEVPNTPRSIPAEELSGMIEKHGFVSRLTDSVTEAVLKAREEMPLTVVCGSLYLYEYAVNI